MVPLLALDHVGQGGAHRVPDTGEADVDRLVPDLVRHLPHRGEARHAGVGQQDVDVAELVDGAVDEPSMAGRSRTSASTARQRRPVSSTAFSVSSRSSVVEVR